MPPPDLLLRGAREARRAFAEREAQLGRRIRSTLDDTYRGYHDDLRRWFGSHSETRTIDEKPVQFWDPLVIYQDGTLHEALTEFHDLTDVATDDLDEMLDEDLDEAMVEGHRRELWLLAMGGLPAEDYADSLPDDDQRHTLLLLAGVAGLSWLNRLRRWQAEVNAQGDQWLRASIVGGRTFDDTLQGLEAVETTFGKRVMDLAGNERHRAAGLGADVARMAVAQDHEIAEFWVTRQDALVCPFCAVLHMTVTTLKPITDSHPACRCRKVPVPAGYVPEPMAYEDFLDALE